MKSNISTWIFTVIIPLILGVLIYYFTRSHSIFFLNWVDQIINFESHLVEYKYWFVFNMPDLLWSFSLTSALLLVWDKKFLIQRVFWLITGIILSIFLEVSLGVYDINDLMFIVAGWMMAILINILISNKPIDFIPTKSRFYRQCVSLFVMIIFTFFASASGKSDSDKNDCEKMQTGKVYFENRSQTSQTYEVIWNGTRIATIEPGKQSKTFTFAANVSHKLVFKIANSREYACDESQPILYQCEETSYFCTK